ncbi:MAG: hypothetical protein ACP5P1_02045 [Acidimicrobiales bacterium]
MAIKENCRHYLGRSTPSGDLVQRCRLSVNTEGPFDCPDGCLFEEARLVSDAGWARGPTTRMANTADGLAGLPPPPKRRKGRKGR